MSMHYYLFLTAVGLTPGGSSTVHIWLTPGGSSTVHIYTQTVHRIQRTEHTTIRRKKFGNWGLCPIFVSYTLAFALQLRKKNGKPSVRVVEKCPDIPVAVVQYTFTHKQYTEQHNETEIKLNYIVNQPSCDTRLYPFNRVHLNYISYFNNLNSVCVNNMQSNTVIQGPAEWTPK
jgi:hypothetical protein